VRDDVDIEGGIEGVEGWREESLDCWSCVEGSEEDGGVEVVVVGPRGDVLVGPLSTKFLIRSGVLAGVTLSMNWNEGRRRTVVLSSAWSGIGMLEAESISFFSG
jgi:hypothetical protein